MKLNLLQVSSLVLAVIGGIGIGYNLGHGFAQNVVTTNGTSPIPAQEIIMNTFVSWWGVILGVAAVIGVASKWIKTLVDKGILDKRFLKIADLGSKFADTVEQTDRGVSEHIDLFAMFLNTLSKNDQFKTAFEDPKLQAILLKANANAEDWQKDLQDYYDKLSAKAGDASGDGVVRELAATEKRLVPN